MVDKENKENNFESVTNILMVIALVAILWGFVFPMMEGNVSEAQQYFIYTLLIFLGFFVYFQWFKKDH